MRYQQKAEQQLFPEWQKLEQASQLRQSVGNLPRADQAFAQRRAAQLVQQAATAGLPQMQGLAPEYNGPFGEANRLQGEQSDYQKQYDQRLASYRQYAKTHQRDVQTANEAIEALQRDHHKRSLEYQ